MDDPENNTFWQDYVSHDRKIFELGDLFFRKIVSGMTCDHIAIIRSI
jgi:hypothetical protein